MSILGNCLPGDTILLKDDSGFAGKEIERETLNTIIHLRLRETFELLKRSSRKNLSRLSRRRHFHHRRVQSPERDRSSRGGNFRNPGPRCTCADHVGTNICGGKSAVLHRHWVDQIRPGDACRQTATRIRPNFWKAFQRKTMRTKSDSDASDH